MLVDLNISDLVSMVNGTQPHYGILDDLRVRPYGSYSGSYDRWTWDKHELAKLSEAELFSLYNLCKEQ
jgi:hypothetical protein